MLSEYIRIYQKSCRHQLSYCGLHVCAVSVFGKKYDAVCSFLAISVRFWGFQTPLTPPSLFTEDCACFMELFENKGQACCIQHDVVCEKLICQDNMGYWTSIRSRWLQIGQVLSSVFMFTDWDWVPYSPYNHRKKKNTNNKDQSG